MTPSDERRAKAERILEKVFNHGLESALDMSGLEPWDVLTVDEALTQLDEIDLAYFTGVIGSNEKPDIQLGANSYIESGEVQGRNQLRAQLREQVTAELEGNHEQK